MDMVRHPLLAFPVEDLLISLARTVKRDHYPIQLLPPDITPHRISNMGVDYVHEFDSGHPGPTVLVQALTHGNEYCGALALDWFLGQGMKPCTGRLIVVFANIEAYAQFNFDNPHASRYVDEDLNRVWADETLFGTGDSVELTRARQLQPFIDRADYLLDIHSMDEPCRPLMVCGMTDKHLELARKIGMPADLLMDTGHPAGLRMRDRGSFNDSANPRQAVLVECGQHWEASSEQVARNTLLRFLVATGVMPYDDVAPLLSIPLPTQQRVLRVTESVVRLSQYFRFLVPMEAFGVVEKAGTPIAQDGCTIWRSPYDQTVLVMPSLRHHLPGSTQVRLGHYEEQQHG